MKRPADKVALKLFFKTLMLKLNGFNYTEYDDRALFDFNYDQYCLTMVLDKDGICLADNVDIYDELENYIGNYSLNEVFVTGLDTDN